MPIPDDHLRDVVLEALRRDFGHQWLGLTQAVAWVATERGLYPPRDDTRIVEIDPADEPALRAEVDRLIAAGLLALGVDGRNARWPWLSVTPLGRRAIAPPGA